jgi:hypothetical protein
MTRALLATVAGVLTAGVAFAAGVKSPEEVRPRVDHHLRLAADLAQHFESILATPCPQFSTSAEWNRYLDGEVDRVVLLMAHVEQAWVEAKTTDDDDVRRAAKAPRRRVQEARALLDKLVGCAEANGSPLPVMAMWKRIEQQVPSKQAEITLPR